METTQTLQELINKRASKKLNEDLDKISDFLSDNWKLLDNYTIRVKIDNVEATWTIKKIFDSSRYKLFEKNIEDYIKAETDNFIERINKIESSIAELRDEVDNIQNNGN